MYVTVKPPQKKFGVQTLIQLQWLYHGPTYFSFNNVIHPWTVVQTTIGLITWAQWENYLSTYINHETCFQNASAYTEAAEVAILQLKGKTRVSWLIVSGGMWCTCNLFPFDSTYIHLQHLGELTPLMYIYIYILYTYHIQKECQCHMFKDKIDS